MVTDQEDHLGTGCSPISVLIDMISYAFLNINFY